MAPILKKMQAAGLDSLLITDLAAIRWFCGFSGSSAKLLCTASGCWLFTDFRYRQQASLEVAGATPVILEGGLGPTLFSGSYPLGAAMGVQAERIVWKEALDLSEGAGTQLRIVPTEGFFEEFRMVKRAGELLRLRRAAAISEQVFSEVLPLISPKASELDIAAEISFRHRRLGAEGDSFEPIVASGPRAAMPHARPTAARFKPGSLILIDMGCRFEGYASDQTRTISLGRAEQDARAAHEVVRRAQELGLSSARVGMTGGALDGLVRDFLRSAGYGEAFGHSLGHGVGMEVHEEPRIAPKSDTVLGENMVFTIEPGVYLPGRFGVRIEDTVVLGPDGAEPLQKGSKELIEL